MATQTKTISALLMVMGVLLLGVLACNSDAPDFAPIARTATLTITPTVPYFDESNAPFQTGDTVQFVGTFQVFLMRIPQEDTGLVADRSNGSCFRDIRVEIIDVTMRGGTIFYKTNCGSEDGWTIEEHLELVEE